MARRRMTEVELLVRRVAVLPEADRAKFDEYLRVLAMAGRKATTPAAPRETRRKSRTTEQPKPAQESAA